MVQTRSKSSRVATAPAADAATGKSAPRYAEPGPASKRRRLANSLFDVLQEPDTDYDEAAAGVVRMLDYEPEEGLLQILNFIVKAAGADTPFQLIDPASAARDLDAACKEYAPASYPLLRRDFVRRFAAFMPAFVAKTFESGNIDAASTLLRYVAALAGVPLRSLRHAAVAYAGMYATSLRGLRDDLEAERAQEAARANSGSRAAARATQHHAELTAQLERIFELRDACLATIGPRLRDTSPEIRQDAVAALGVWADVRLLGSLVDEAPAVRRAALLSLSSVLNSATAGSSPISQAQWRRVAEIARRDADVKCRVTALNVVRAAAEEHRTNVEGAPPVPDNVLRLVTAVFDDEPTVRSAAAELLAVTTRSDPGLTLTPTELNNEEHDAQTWPQILRAVAAVGGALDAEAAAALAAATQIGVAPLARLLLQDFSRADAGEWKAALADEVTMALPTLLFALDAFAATERAAIAQIRSQEDRRAAEGFFVATLLEHVPDLMTKFAYSDEHLAAVVRLGAHIGMDAVVRHGLDAEYDALLNKMATAFSEHPNVSVMNAVSDVFDLAVGVDGQESLFGDECRVHLNALFEGVFASELPLDDRAMQVVYLARWLDVSEAQELPLWDISTPAVRTLVRVLGIKGDASLAQRAAVYLVGSLPAAATDLLQVLTVARMRGIDLSTVANAATLEPAALRGAQSQTVEAARAAGVLAS